MREEEKQQYLRLGVGLLFILVLFSKLIPIIVVAIITYSLYQLSRRKPIIPFAAARFFPPSMVAAVNRTAKTYTTSHHSTQSTSTRKHIFMPKHIIKKVLFTLIIVIALSFAGSFFTIIDAGETGVRTLFGKVRDQELSSGFHFKNPLERVHTMNIRTQEYTMSIFQGEGKLTRDDSISALTKEGLKVDLDITVLYRLQEDRASDVYRDVGESYEDVIIRPQIRSMIREVIALYSAREIYSEKREEATNEIQSRLQAELSIRGIEVEETLLRNIQLPANLANSIQEKLQAEQESQRYDFILEKEGKEAERKRVEAVGQRDSQQIINQSLTDRYLQYLYLQNLKDLEGTIYIPTDPGSGIPLFRSL